MPANLLKPTEQTSEQIDGSAMESAVDWRQADLMPDYGKIGGWLQHEEAELLVHAASKVVSGCILEIGSYRGRSTVALAAGSGRGANVPVFAIEPHERAFGSDGRIYGPNDRRAFLQTLLQTKLFGVVRLVNVSSAVAARGWKQPIALLFIDGDYRYEAVSSYFFDWQPFLADDALVVFYAATAPGPSQLIQELVEAGCLSAIASKGSLSILKMNAVQTKVQPASVKPAAAASVYPAVFFDIKNKEPRHHISKVAHFIYYGGNGSYLYQPIPKCACTSMKTTLLELEKLPVDPNEWRRHNKRLNRFPGAEHLPVSQQKALFEGKTDSFKFVFVRDPYSRMASVYADKILKGYENKSKFWIQQIEASAKKLGASLSKKITFDEFVRIASAQTVKEMDPHWRPQYDVGRFGIINWDFVGHLEMLSSDMLYVLERLNAPEDLKLKATQPHNVTGASHAIWAEVSAETRRAFLKTFEIDFDILRYPLRQEVLGTRKRLSP